MLHFQLMFLFLRYIRRMEVLGHMVALFSVTFWKSSILFSTVAALTHSHKGECNPFSPHPCQYLLFVFFLIAILTGVRCTPVGFICISLMICDVEHLCIYLMAICMSSLEKYGFKNCPFKNWIICFFLLLLSR